MHCYNFINSDSASFSCCCQYRADVENAKVTFVFSFAFYTRSCMTLVRRYFICAVCVRSCGLVKLEQNSSCAVALSCVTLVRRYLSLRSCLRSGFRDTVQELGWQDSSSSSNTCQTSRAKVNDKVMCAHERNPR